MNWTCINLNIDGSVAAQEELRDCFDEIVDLRHCQDILRLYSNRKGHRILKETIAALRSKHPGSWITFMGSGDYNHVSAYLLETLPDEAKPITLVLLDNHPDWFDMPLKYHCGTWVCTVLRLPYIESAVLLGMTSNDLQGQEFWFSPFRDLCSGRITIHPYLQDKVRVPLRWPDKVLGVASSSRSAAGVELSFDTIANLGVQGLCDRLSNKLSGKNVILSIDKDCLLPEYASSDWEQGRLTLEDLKSIIRTVARSSRLLGVDVCGEQAPDPLKGPWKRYDAGRLLTKRPQDWDKVNDLNQKTNLELIEVLKQEVGAHPGSDKTQSWCR